VTPVMMLSRRTGMNWQALKSSRRSLNVFHQRSGTGDHSMIAGGVAGPET